MNKALKKDAQRLLLALVLGVFGFIGGFLYVILSSADSWFESFSQCLTASGRLGLICGGVFAGLTVLFPSTVKSLIRFFRKEANKDE